MRFFEGAIFAVTIGSLLWIPIILPWSKMNGHEATTWVILISVFLVLTVVVWTEPKK